jgi:hypothetical protein
VTTILSEKNLPHTLKTEAAVPPEKLVDIYQSTRRQILESLTLKLNDIGNNPRSELCTIKQLIETQQ